MISSPKTSCEWLLNSVAHDPNKMECRAKGLDSRDEFVYCTHSRKSQWRRLFSNIILFAVHQRDGGREIPKNVSELCSGEIWWQVAMKINWTNMAAVTVKHSQSLQALLSGWLVTLCLCRSLSCISTWLCTFISTWRTGTAKAQQ